LNKLSSIYISFWVTAGSQTQSNTRKGNTTHNSSSQREKCQPLTRAENRLAYRNLMGTGATWKPARKQPSTCRARALILARLHWQRVPLTRTSSQAECLPLTRTEHQLGPTQTVSAWRGVAHLVVGEKENQRREERRREITKECDHCADVTFPLFKQESSP
jgi:hypothetical protein